MLPLLACAAALAVRGGSRAGLAIWWASARASAVEGDAEAGAADRAREDALSAGERDADATRTMSKGEDGGEDRKVKEAMRAAAKAVKAAAARAHPLKKGGYERTSPDDMD